MKHFHSFASINDLLSQAELLYHKLACKICDYPEKEDFPCLASELNPSLTPT